MSLQVHADPRVDLQQSFEQLLASGGFRGIAQGHVFGPDLPELAGDVEVQFPDRIHASTENMEFIAIGERAWISVAGLWTSLDRSLVPVSAFDLRAARQAIASIRDARIEGTARTHQCATHVYAFRAHGQLPGAAASGDLRAWRCDDSGRIARIEATDARTRERVIFEFDWSRPAHIAAPAR
ncbi:MAG: hypothetical protein E6K53_16865 [Gammaproteobacteria bacterium]|nr:MAG: hypothetical protein E6K53_16865 [Gammaproteobacteria bacterium]